MEKEIVFEAEIWIRRPGEQLTGTATTDSYGQNLTMMCLRFWGATFERSLLFDLTLECTVRIAMHFQRRKCFAGKWCDVELFRGRQFMVG